MGEHIFHSKHMTDLVKQAESATLETQSAAGAASSATADAESMADHDGDGAGEEAGASSDEADEGAQQKAAGPARKKPVVCIVLGMAGSGKTTLLQRINLQMVGDVKLG